MMKPDWWELRLVDFLEFFWCALMHGKYRTSPKHGLADWRDWCKLCNSRRTWYV